MKIISFSACLLMLAGSLAPTRLSAQDLTGIWRGHFRSNVGLERLSLDDDRYKMEVQIAQDNHIFHAVTYSYKMSTFYGKADASGTVNPVSKKVLLRETRILEVRALNGGACIMTCFLQYSKLGNEEFLQGTYNSVSASDTLSNCGKGSIFLHRVTSTDFHKEPFLVKKEKELLAAKKKQTPVTKPASPPVAKAKPGMPKAGPRKESLAKLNPPRKAAPQPAPPAPVKRSVTALPEQASSGDSALSIDHKTIPAIVPRVLATRANEKIKSITVNNADIYLSIYDDGAIDNDTVSVYYDNKLVVSKARISDQPVKLTIRVEPSDQPHELVMVAENLGDIPPNTSLMVVRDGDKKYEVRVVSTEQKNAVISFQYKKIE